MSCKNLPRRGLLMGLVGQLCLAATSPLLPLQGLGCLQGMQYHSTVNGPLLEAIVPISPHGRNPLDKYRNLRRIHLPSVGHFRVEISDFHWDGMLLRRYRPRMLDGPAPELAQHFFGRASVREVEWNQIAPELLRDKYRALEAEGQSTYRNKVEQIVAQGLHEMRETQGFTDKEVGTLQELAHEFTAYSTYFEVFDDNGDSVGTFRVIDAPYGIVRDYSGPKPKALMANIGPLAASFHLSPSQLQIYNQLTSNPTPVMYDPRSFAQGNSLLNLPPGQAFDTDAIMHRQIYEMVAAEQGGLGTPHRHEVLRRIMIERKYQQVLIDQGFPKGFMPRLGYGQPFMFHRDPIYFQTHAQMQPGQIFTAAMLSEPGDLSVNQNLPKPKQRKVKALIGTGFLLHVLDDLYSPEVNGSARAYATFGNAVAEQMYTRYQGFQPTHITVPFNNGTAHVLMANAYEVVLRYLEVSAVYATPLREQISELIRLHPEDFVLVHFFHEHGHEIFGP